MCSEKSLADAHAALAEGRWRDARFGLAVLVVVGRGPGLCCGRAYALFRQSGEGERAAQCAVWLVITYEANFADFSAANGWIGRAERLWVEERRGRSTAGSWWLVPSG